MKEFNLNMTYATDMEIANELRHQLRKYDTPKKSTRQYWMGFGLGVLFMALLNIGDAHFCVGECDSSGFAILEVLE